MKNFFPIAFLMAAALAFLACEGSGGNSSETVNGIVSASVMHADGTPAARVKVMVVDDSGWLAKVSDGQPVVLDSAITDDKGAADVRIPPGGRCNLQIDGVGEGLLVRGANALAGGNAGVTVRNFKLAHYGSFSGHVTADSGVAKELRLFGTAYSAGVGANGAYAFPGLAEGAFALVAQVAVNGKAHASLARSLGVTSGLQQAGQDLQVSASRVLIDDFEQGLNQTTLGRILGDGLWYTLNDSSELGNSSIQAGVVSDSQAYAGTSVRAEYVMGTRIVHPWAIMGLSIGASKAGSSYDFSDMRAVSFWAKGRGRINVRFLSKTITDLFTDSCQYYYELQLPPVWTHVTIPADSLRLPDYASAAIKAHSWKEVSSAIQSIDFTAEPPAANARDTVLFFLDELALEGVPLEKLSR